MTPYETNISDLIDIYFQDGEAFWIIEEVGRGIGHHIETIKNFQRFKKEPRSIYERGYGSVFQDLDRILDAISTFEIAAMSGLWGSPLKNHQEIMIHEFLNNHYLKYYYETLNPRCLPQLFKLRLDLNPGVPTFEISENTQQGLFSYIENDAWFLREISNFEILRDNSSILLATSNLADRRVFLRRIAYCIEHESEWAEMQILKAIEYFANFKDCISAFSHNKLIQSAIWHRHEILFRRDEVIQCLNLAMLKMSGWEVSDEEKFDPAFHDHLHQRKHALTNLCEGSYQSPLRNLMRKLRLMPEREFAD